MKWFLDRTIAAVTGFIGALAISSPLPMAWAADSTPASAFWHTRCDQTNNGRANCVVEQFAVVMPQNVVAAHLRLSPTDRPDQLLMQLTVPLGVFLARGLQLHVDDTPPIELSFEQCLADGCHASAVLDKTALEMLTHGDVLAVRYALSNRDLPLNIPLRLQGLAEMLKQPPQKK